ncbi:hypothetical protein D3C85_1460670 [compost metagenome]
MQVGACQQVAERARLTHVAGVFARRRHDRLCGAGRDGVATLLEHQRRRVALVELEDFPDQYDVVATVVDMRGTALHSRGAAREQRRRAHSVLVLNAVELLRPGDAAGEASGEIILIVGENMHRPVTGVFKGSKALRFTR